MYPKIANYFKSLIWIKATLKHLKVAMNQFGAAEGFSVFLLVAVETKDLPPIRELQEAAANALRPRYAFFLFLAFPLPRNPLRCIALARDIVLVSLTAFRTVTYVLFCIPSSAILVHLVLLLWLAISYLRCIKFSF